MGVPPQWSLLWDGWGPNINCGALWKRKWTLISLLPVWAACHLTPPVEHDRLTNLKVGITSPSGSPMARGGVAIPKRRQGQPGPAAPRGPAAGGGPTGVGSSPFGSSPGAGVAAGTGRPPLEARTSRSAPGPRAASDQVGMGRLAGPPVSQTTPHATLGMDPLQPDAECQRPFDPMPHRVLRPARCSC